MKSRCPNSPAGAGLLWLATWAGCGPSVTTAPPPSRLFDPLAYHSLPGPTSASGVHDGATRRYEHRRASLVANVLMRSGERPQLVFAFPPSDAVIGIWFSPAPAQTQLYAGAAGEEPLEAGGGLVAVRREPGEHALHGVRGTLRSDATRLSTEFVLLGGSDAASDYDRVCLEDPARFPELNQVRFELDAERDALRVRREPSGSAPALELLLVGKEGTRITLRERGEAPRPACPLPPGQIQPGSSSAAAPASPSTSSP